MRLCLALTVALLCVTPAIAEPALELDHVLIYSKTGAPERVALEKAGFVISPAVNHHTGQGTSSVTVEFVNGYLELLYPDPAVSVSGDMRRVAQLFRTRSEWRKTGVSPFGLQLRRTSSTPVVFPFPTVKVHSDWMAPGDSIELLTPRAMTKALGLFVTPTPVDETRNVALVADSVQGAMFRHPNGARRLTGVEVVAPSADRLPPAAAYVSDAGAAIFTTGKAWLMIITLDSGKQGKVRDLRPDLPLVIHY